jgi:hypothetical protein
MIAQEKPIGPTRETMRHGDYVRPEGKGALAVYTNKGNTLLMRLRAYDTISARQFQAGLAFEATHYVVWGSPTPSRDSTIPPIGGKSHETETQAERWSNARARLHTILNRDAVGPAVYAVLRQVCIWGEGFGGRDRGALRKRYDALRKGLDECAAVYGISHDGD